MDRPVVLFLLFALLFFTRDNSKHMLVLQMVRECHWVVRSWGMIVNDTGLFALLLPYCFECCVSFSPLSFSQIISSLSVLTFFLGGMVRKGHSNIFDISLRE